MNQLWHLSCPAPETGTIVDGVYNTGPVLADDMYSVTGQDGKMQIVTEAGLQDFEDYGKLLKASGAEMTFENQTALNRYFGFRQGDTVFQVSFFARLGEIRVMEDPHTESPTEFNFPAEGPEETIVYQYGLYYDPNADVTDRTMNCGMMYLIRLPDNSLFVIDSGHRYQWTREALQNLWNFLHDITHTAPGGRIRIACWYFTHAHNDHTDGCIALLGRWHDQILVERVMQGYPSYQVHSLGYEAESQTTKRYLLKYDPKVQQLHVHTGQKMTMGNVELEFLFAEEDHVRASSPEELPLRDFNGTSPILKVTLGGKSILFLADTNQETQERLKEISDERLWKADMVQVGHHCINRLDDLYRWIAAPQALIPNTFRASHDNGHRINLMGVLKHIRHDSVFYEGSATYGFVPAEDGFRVADELPIVGGPYDGSLRDLVAD